MALTSTMYVFSVSLSDIDRGVYETLEIRAAMHPSESADYLLMRVLAYCLEYREGISFSKGGVSDRDEPTLFARDLTGAFTLWAEIGAPSAERLHLAAKSAPRVAVYCHRNPHMLMQQLQGAAIHRAAEIAFYTLEKPFLDALVRRLERRMSVTLTVSEQQRYCAVGEETLETPVVALHPF
jgi:uncharacterized protein YaeQ